MKKQITINDFTIIGISDLCWYASLKIEPTGLEICLEPCAGGFCVAFYVDRKLIKPKICTDAYSLKMSLSGNESVKIIQQNLWVQAVQREALRIVNNNLKKILKSLYGQKNKQV